MISVYSYWDCYNKFCGLDYGMRLGYRGRSYLDHRNIFLYILCINFGFSKGYLSKFFGIHRTSVFCAVRSLGYLINNNRDIYFRYIRCYLYLRSLDYLWYSFRLSSYVFSVFGLSGGYFNFLPSGYRFLL